MVTGDPICPHCGSHWWSAHACSGALLGQRYETSDPMDPHKLAESVRELSERNDQLSTELSALKARAEAAEALLGEAYAALRERQHHARHGSTFFCPDCGSEKTEAKPHRSYCGLGKLLSSIDAALQAARETP